MFIHPLLSLVSNCLTTLSSSTSSFSSPLSFLKFISSTPLFLSHLPWHFGVFLCTWLGKRAREYNKKAFPRKMAVMKIYALFVYRFLLCKYCCECVHEASKMRKALQHCALLLLLFFSYLTGSIFG